MLFVGEHCSLPRPGCKVTDNPFPPRVGVVGGGNTKFHGCVIPARDLSTRKGSCDFYAQAALSTDAVLEAGRYGARLYDGALVKLHVFNWLSDEVRAKPVEAVQIKTHALEQRNPLPKPS